MCAGSIKMQNKGHTLPDGLMPCPPSRLRVFPCAWLKVGLLALLLNAAAVSAGPVFDTSTPLSFFTNVASRLLSAQMNVNLGQLEIYPTNQYTPAVHRLLQVTANILDAQNTNFYPSVFRPLFSEDASNDLFIIGYQQVTNVAGPADPQLAPPYSVAALVNAGFNTTPLADSNGPVNVYGVPWVIGAKMGLPNFNQLALINAASVTRELELTRDSVDPRTAAYATNQMYIIGVSNSLAVTFWNSYSSAYPRPLQVGASDLLNVTLTNQVHTWYSSFTFATNVAINSWPGAQWSGSPPNRQPNSASFISFPGWDIFLPPTTYNFATASFDPSGQWQATSPPLPQLPQFGLLITNYLQAYILDGSNVIDYVQLASPIAIGGLNQALADPNYPEPNNTRLQWSTNSPSAPTPWGVYNQLAVSGNPALAPTAGGQWEEPSGFPTSVAPTAANLAVFFNGFFTPSFYFPGILTPFVNTQMVILAPYTPTRTVYSSFLLQANDPLVHYTASDLDGQTGATAVWTYQVYQNGIWYHSDDLVDQPLPVPSLSPVGGRYQPWGQKGQLAGISLVDTNPYNLAYKDPLVWGPDYWNFPTGQSWSLSWVGQVHRGTPWQTVYLKSSNILAAAVSVGVNLLNIGYNTWANWTGDLQTNLATGIAADSINSAPVWDFNVVSLLAAMLNTNALATQFSVNNPNVGTWEAALDGMTVLTNTLPVVHAGIPTQYSPILISSNSAQAALIANAIQSIRTNTVLFPQPTFQWIGEVLATPQLSIQSPFLNLGGTGTLYNQVAYGISDQAYEAIPSQLLPLLRVDSTGQMISTNGQIQVQFSGYDGHEYAIQVSPDLLNWSSVSTNAPTNGVFSAALPTPVNSAAQFYRSLLIQ